MEDRLVLNGTRFVPESTASIVPMPKVAEKGHKMTAQNGSSVVESDDMKLAAMKDASLQLCTLSESVS